MSSDQLHPNLIKRAQRVRSSMVGKYAYYFPVGIAQNNRIPVGSRVEIIAFEHNGGKSLSMVRVKPVDNVETSVLFSDLGFIGM